MRRGDRMLPRHRRRVLRGCGAQGSRWRLVPARHRGRRARRDGGLAARPRAVARAPARGIAAARRLSRDAARASAAARCRNGGFPHRHVPMRRRTHSFTASSTTKCCTSATSSSRSLFVDAPWVPGGERVKGERIGDDCWRVTARYGFMEQPDVRQRHRNVVGRRLAPRAAGGELLPVARDHRRRRPGERRQAHCRQASLRRWRATRAARATSSTFPPIASSSWGRAWKSDQVSSVQ